MRWEGKRQKTGRNRVRVVKRRVKTARSVRTYVPLLEALVTAPPHLWTVDANTYDEAANVPTHETSGSHPVLDRVWRVRRVEFG